MAPKLYMINGSPPCRAVLAVAQAVNVNLNMHKVDFVKGEHLSPEYLKINPLHSVPVLEDNSKIICDSHAINIYLVEKYAKDDSLYPNDVHKKAMVNEKLFFDATVLWRNFEMIVDPLATKEVNTVPPEKAKYVQDSYGVLNRYLEGQQWVTGDSITVADFSIYTTITSLEVLVEIDTISFPNVTAWIKRIKEFPWLKGDDEQLEDFVTWVKTFYDV